MACSSAASPSLSKSRALGLLSDLLAGFGEDGFQRELQELARTGARVGSDLRRVEGRLSLTLAVQRDILPRYGLTGDEDGVLAMKMAIRKHMGDPRVAQKSMDIRKKLLISEACVAQKSMGDPRVAQRSMDVLKVAPAAVEPLAAEASLVSTASAKTAPSQAAPGRSSPLPAPAQAPAARPTKACEAAIKKDQEKHKEVEVMVQHARGQGQLLVKVSAVEPSMLQVKEAVVRALGRGSVADVQLVMWGGGMFVNHRDCDTVMTDRVFSIGLDLRAVN